MQTVVDSPDVGDNARNDQMRGEARASVLGIPVNATNMEGALAIIARHMESGRRGYVCAVSVHGILEAKRDEAVAEALAGSLLNVPDGTPTVWVGRMQGFRRMDHVTGPDLMLEVFGRREFARYSHFFYGGKPGVAEDLAATFSLRFPWTRIAGVYTPPFRDLNPEEERAVISRINASGADMVWVGISTPRQDLWMRRMLPFLDAGLMFGVGAAFDLHTGRIRGCPRWVKRAGLHWLHRLAQDPRRLWRRNVRNTAFLWHIALQLSGLKRFPLKTATVSKDGFRVDRMVVRTCSDAASAHEVHR